MKKIKINATHAIITAIVNNIANDITKPSQNSETTWVPAFVLGPFITRTHATTPIPDKTHLIMFNNKLFEVKKWKIDQLKHKR